MIAGKTPVLVHNNNPHGPNCATAGHVYRGGIYRDLKDPATKRNVPGTEINHLPSKQSIMPFGIRMKDGPAIQMDYDDHRAVYSTGSSHESQAWQTWQRELVQSGRIDMAIQMDINDIRNRFGTKYDGAIKEMVAGLGNHAGYQSLRTVPGVVG
ncbi:hypothetical protein HCA58_22050 [Micromonospora sp. HNM0581]|uniref:hypothetical protein n=1 Tax=Micromonospora sp. HNM0581 TaxID=2716341 RepID=UPI00146DCF0A|nr:hypothetical protein [Micromonospora sp. HNM0581]NLU80981.1 hypothetical protein [Micromonospora sp. HNM0581]